MSAPPRLGGSLVARGGYCLNLICFATLCVFSGTPPRTASIVGAGLEGVLLLVTLGLPRRRALAVRSGLAAGALVAGCVGAFSLLEMTSASLLLDQAGAALVGDLLGCLVMVLPAVRRAVRVAPTPVAMLARVGETLSPTARPGPRQDLL